MQGAYAPPSTEHVNVAPTSPVNEMLALVLFVNADGAPVRTGASGAIESTVHSYEATAPTLPTGSVSRTLKLCGPSCMSYIVVMPMPSPRVPQSTYAAPSLEHSRKEGNPPPSPVILIVMLLVFTTPEGIGSESDRATGAAGPVVSTVHEAEPASDVLPASSVAFTDKLCAPSARPLKSCGLVQGA